MKKLNIYTFRLFWQKYHFYTHYNKVNKTRCQNLWENCNFQSKKTKAIRDLNKNTTLNCVDYLKIKLN